MEVKRMQYNVGHEIPLLNPCIWCWLLKRLLFCFSMFSLHSFLAQERGQMHHPGLSGWIASSQSGQGVYGSLADTPSSHSLTSHQPTLYHNTHTHCLVVSY